MPDHNGAEQEPAGGRGGEDGGEEGPAQEEADQAPEQASELPQPPKRIALPEDAAAAEALKVRRSRESSVSPAPGEASWILLAWMHWRGEPQPVGHALQAVLAWTSAMMFTST